MRTIRWASGASLGLILGACGGMGDNSNPTLAIQSAQVQGNSATLNVLVANPGDHNLTLTGMDYELVLGPLPVASGSYSTDHVLPADGSATVSLQIPFDQPALDPEAKNLSLTGVMSFEDHSAGGSMGINSASFDASASVQ